MTENSVKILFEVKGGDSVDVGSGAKIKEQLLAIAAKVSKELKLQINVDKDHFTAQLQELKKTMRSELGNVQINPSGGTNSSSDIKEQTVGIKEIYTQLEKVYSLQAKVDKAKSGSLVDVKSSKELDKQRGILGEMMTQFVSINGEHSKAVSLVKDYEKALQSSLIKEQEANAVAQVKLRDKAASLYTENGFDEVIKRSSRAKWLVDDFSKSLNEALDRSGGTLTKQQIEELNTKFVETQAKLREIKRDTDTTGNAIKKAFSEKIIQTFAKALIMLAVRALKQVYTNVVKIDTAMTQLKIVTQANAEAYDNFAKKVAESAKKIGSNITDLISSTTVFARLGYDLDEAAILAEKTTAYSQVAAVEINDATKSITAIVKGFNIEASQLESVIDRLIYIGNHYAISSAEIGEAMNNAASALSSNGNNLDEAIGILTAANVTLQNISKSSTGVRTIAARISASTAELIESGEDVGDVLATADLDARMRGFGIAIVDANGELRSTYDILSDVADKWGELDSVQRASIRDMLAGTRQQNVFDSIMQNWKDAKQIVEESSKSVGSYQDAVDKHVNSIQGRLNSLKASWENFSKTILDSEIVKFFVSLLEAIVDALNAVMSLGNGFVAKGALITAAVVLILGSINKLIPKLQTLRLQFKLFGMELGVHASGIKGFIFTIGAALKKFLAENTPMLIISTIITLMSALEGKTRAFTEVIVGAAAFIALGITMAIKGVDATMKAFMASNPIGWILAAITAVVAIVKGVVDLIESFNPSYESLKEAAKDSIDTWKKAEDELKDVSKKLTEVNEKIEEIKKQGKFSLVDEKEVQYLEQERANLESIQKTKETEAKLAKQKAAQDAAAALNKYNNTSTKERSVWAKIFTLGISAIVEASADTKQEKFDKILKDYKNASSEDKEFITKTLKEYQELLDGFNFGDDPTLDNYLRQYYSILDRYNIQTGNAAITWHRVLADTRFSSEVEKLRQLANSQTVTMESIASAAPNFINYLREIGFSVDDTTESSNALINSIKGLRQRLQSKASINFTDDMEIMQDKFDAFKSALEDVKKIGVVTMDNITKILSSEAEGYPTLLKKYFTFVNGIGYTLREDLRDKTLSEVLRLIAEEELVEYANEVAAAQELLAGMTSDNEDYATAVNNLAIAQDNLNVKTAEWATILREQAIEDETDRLEKLQDALENQLDAYKELIDIRKDLLKTYQQELNYQKELAQKQQKVADLQTQLNLAKLDNSASGQARVRELQKQLESAKEELDDFTLDKAIDVLTNKIDSQYDAYKQFIDTEIQKITDTIDDLKYSLNVALTSNENQSEPEEVVVVEQEAVQEVVPEVVPSYNSAKVEEAEVRSASSGSIVAAKAFYANPQLKKEYGTYENYKKGIKKETTKKKTHRHSGGFIGDPTLKSNEELAVLLKGEYVSTPKQMDNFIKNTLPAIVNAAGTGATFEYNSPLITIQCDSINEDSLPRLQEIVNEAVKQIGRQMEGALSRTGYKKKF